MKLNKEFYSKIKLLRDFIQVHNENIYFKGEHSQDKINYLKQNNEEEANKLEEENRKDSIKHEIDYNLVLDTLELIDLDKDFENLSEDEKEILMKAVTKMPKLNYSIFSFSQKSRTVEQNQAEEDFENMRKIQEGIETSTNEKKITLVLGQTAAGKSFSLSNEKFRKENYTVDTDEYREFHPGIIAMKGAGAEFFEINSFNLTHDYASHMNTIARTKMEEEQKEIVTDTVDLDWWMTDEFERYKKMGYEIDLKVIVTNPIISRFSKGLRYLQEIEKESFGRYVTDEDHDAGLKGIKETIADLNNGEGIGKIDNISLFAGQKETIISDTNKISDIFQDLSEIPVSEQKWLSSKLGEFYLLYKKHSKKMDKNIKKELLANYEILKSELEIPELGEEKKIVNPPKI
jgi:UDP-N-acetylglucosamine kinase